jgi:hypothetical protein
METICDMKVGNAWAALERLAREIDPSLPADLTGKEIRITLSKDCQSVECYDRELTD